MLGFFQSSIAQTPCSDFDFSFEQHNQMACDGEASFTLLEGGQTAHGVTITYDPGQLQGITLSNFTDHGQGLVDIDGISISGYNGIGTITFIVSTGQGDCEIVATVVECCQGISYDILAVNENFDPYNPSGSLSGKTVIMFGDIGFATGTHSFDDCEIWLGPDAQMLPDVGVSLDFADSDLDAFCDCRWDRIFLEDNNSLSMSGCTVKGALRSIMATDENSISLIRTDFTDNWIAAYLKDFVGTGSYATNSWTKVDGCTFDATGEPENTYCYNSSLSRVNMTNFLPVVSQNTHDFILVDSENIQIGHESYGTNYFKNTGLIDRGAIDSDQSQFIARNNNFNNVFAVKAYNGSTVNVGGSSSQANTFDVCDNTIDESAAYWDYNDHDITTVICTDPMHQSVSALAPYGGSSFTSNTFTNTSGIASSSELTITGTVGVTSTNVIVSENTIRETPVTIEQIRTGVNGNLECTDNDAQSDINLTLFSLKENYGMDFNDNILKHTVARTNYADNTHYRGALVDNCQNITFSQNSFYNHNRAIHLTGTNNTGTQYTCNRIENSYHGFYLTNTDIDDQGSTGNPTDNIWKYSYVGTNPFSDGIAGTVSQQFFSIDWYFNSTSNALHQPIENHTKIYVYNTSGSAGCVTPKNARLEIEANDSFIIYPNPSAGNFTIKGNFESNSVITIFSTNGAVVYHRKPNLNTIHVNLSDLPKGLYLVKIGNKGKRKYLTKLSLL